MRKHRIYTTSFASVYPHYITKAEKKARTQEEVDERIRWLTGYSQEELQAQLERRTDFETFFAEAPRMNPSRRGRTQFELKGTSFEGYVIAARMYWHEDEGRHDDESHFQASLSGGV